MQRGKVLLRLIFCSCTGLKEMKIVECYFYQVGLESNEEAGSVKKQGIILTASFLTINTLICIYFLVKTAAEINLNHTHALSEIIFVILQAQISNFVLEEICQVGVY